MEESGLAFTLYVQGVKMSYVRETDAVRLKVTTLGRPERERDGGGGETSVEVCQMETHSRNIRRRHLGTHCLGKKIIIA